MSSQESNISGLIDILGDRNKRTFSLPPKVFPYHQKKFPYPFPLGEHNLQAPASQVP